MVEYITDTWKNRKIRLILPLAHFLLSFIYEHSIFKFKLDKNVVTAMAMNDIVSDFTERVFGYVCTKLFAFLLIFALWYLFFKVIDNRKKAYVWVLVALGALVIVSYLATYPYILDQNWDAYVTYSYGIRFWPEYWHSAYSSLVFGGLLMVLPSPAAMAPLQTIYAFGAIGYLYERILESPVLKGRGRWLLWGLLIVPARYALFTSPHRADQYSILGIFFFSCIAMDIIERKKRGTFDTILLMILAGFFSVWRTEGIILGLFAIVVSVIFTYGDTKLMKCMYVGIYLIATLIIMLPQKVGDAKYYGKDYKILNSFTTLQNILNDPSHDLNYDGAVNDLEKISAVTPLDLIALRGMDGFRRYNYNNSRPDINQSMVSKTVRDDYLSAYKNIVKHNLAIYLKTQVSAMGASMGLVDSIYEAPVLDEELTDYPGWEFVGWANGREDILKRTYTEKWTMNITRQKMLLKYINFNQLLKNLSEKTHYRAFASLTIVLTLVGIALTEFINIFKKKIKDLPLGLLAVAIIGQLMAIMLVMPEDNLVYLYPAYYTGIVTITAYFSSKLSCRK